MEAWKKWIRFIATNVFARVMKRHSLLRKAAHYINGKSLNKIKSKNKMKKSIFLVAMFLMISATSFGQFNQPFFRPIILHNTPAYSSGGFANLVLNKTSGRMESAPQGTTASIETDSARNYNFTGSLYCKIKYGLRDTVNLITNQYSPNQKFTFFVVTNGADTTVFIPSTGNVNGSSNYILTGTNNSVSMFLDSTNYWIIK